LPCARDFHRFPLDQVSGVCYPQRTLYQSGGCPANFSKDFRPQATLYGASRRPPTRGRQFFWPGGLPYVGSVTGWPGSEER
jgi:hypothetical protein